MGAVQSVPVVGEAVTAVDSGVKLFSAGYWATVGAIIDNKDAKDAGKKFLQDAGNTWVEYSERNVIVAPIRAAVHRIDGDGAKAKRVLVKMGKSVEQVVDSTPVVGHAKGVYHYIAGDTEHGHDCMKGASRSLAVIGVGAVTGGVGGGLVVGGLAGASTGAAYDGVVTVVESVAKHKDCPYGIIASIDQAIESDKKGDLHGACNSAVNVIYFVTGDFLTGATAAQGAKKLNQATKQRKALRNQIGKESAKDVVDTAKHLEKDLGLLEKTANEMDMNIESQYPNRCLVACAEHQAIDRLGTHGGEANIRTTTVKWDNGNITALKRCDNCVQYGDLVGQVPTDAIDGMPVPTRQFVLDGSWPAVRDAALHAGVGIAICTFCGEADDCTCKGLKTKHSKRELAKHKALRIAFH